MMEKLCKFTKVLFMQNTKENHTSSTSFTYFMFHFIAGRPKAAFLFSLLLVVLLSLFLARFIAFMFMSCM